MQAFHNDPKIKEFYIERVKAHMIADEIEKGYYWENGKGCAVGCTLHSGNHKNYEKELGIPIILAYLEDRIFENLPNKLAKTWPLRFLESIPVGVDLSKVWPKFAIFLLTDSTQCNSRHPQCSVVADYFKRQLNGIEINWSEVAYAAASSYAAAYSAYSAYAAAYASAYASASAYAAASANAAARAANAAADAEAAAYIAQSEKLLELLKECN